MRRFLSKIAFLILVLPLVCKGTMAVGDVRPPGHGASQTIQRGTEQAEEWTRSEIAAAIQAFGAIVAVLAAFLVRHLAHRRDVENGERAPG
tara:strand:+ start:213 stop:485 length:273 start_codon:yes stop_codon:yes gene_type:complete